MADHGSKRRYRNRNEWNRRRFGGGSTYRDGASYRDGVSAKPTTRTEDVSKGHASWMSSSSEFSSVICDDCTDYSGTFHTRDPEETPEPQDLEHRRHHRSNKRGSFCRSNVGLLVFCVTLWSLHAISTNLNATGGIPSSFKEAQELQQQVMKNLTQQFPLLLNTSSFYEMHIPAAAEAAARVSEMKNRLDVPTRDQLESLMAATLHVNKDEQSNAIESNFAATSEIHSTVQQQQQQQQQPELPQLEEIKFRPTVSPDLQRCAQVLLNPDVINEMVYWKSNPADHELISPYYNPSEKYLTFEPDTHGFSSQRMVLEHMVVLAYATGRTLVLPPRQGMRDGTLLSYTDFFDLRESLDKKYKGLRVVGMDEFLQFVANGGYLKNKQGQVLKAPGGQIHWDSSPQIGELYEYLREISTVPFDWDPQICIIGNDEKLLKEMLKGVWKQSDGRSPPSPFDFQGRPTPVKAPAVERFREFLAERKQVCSYEKYKDASVLHIPTTSEGSSLLKTHFYTFWFFDDFHQDLVVKRMVRDELHYNDIIFCAATRIIDWLRTNIGSYSAFHIRGPSYEDVHTDVNANADWVLRETQQYVAENTTIYIATDEANEGFFEPLSKHYRLYFAKDFSGVFDTLLPWHMEMVEQIICARADTFVGTYYSSFSGYINRLRGYYSQIHKSPEGYEDGEIESIYHSPVSVKKEMKTYRSIRKPFLMREFPVAWRDIDADAV